MTDSQTPERPETAIKPALNSIERARRLLFMCLPQILSHDNAMDHLWYANPTSGDARAWSIAAALYILNEAQSFGVDGGWSAQPEADMPANTELSSSALRSAEARGRVRGLREAADVMDDPRLPDDVLDTAREDTWYDALGAFRQALRERADAIEQEQPK